VADFNGELVIASIKEIEFLREPKLGISSEFVSLLMICELEIELSFENLKLEKNNVVMWRKEFGVDIKKIRKCFSSILYSFKYEQ